MDLLQYPWPEWMLTDTVVAPDVGTTLDDDDDGDDEASRASGGGGGGSGGGGVAAASSAGSTGWSRRASEGGGGSGLGSAYGGLAMRVGDWLGSQPHVFSLGTHSEVWGGVAVWHP